MGSPGGLESHFSAMDDIFSVDDDDPQSRPDLGMSSQSIRRANSVKRMRDRAMTLVQKYGGTWSAEALRTEWVIRTIMSINRQYWRNLETRALESERVTKEIEREKARLRRPLAELRRECENLKAALKDANSHRNQAMERAMAVEMQVEGLKRQAEAAETAAAVATAECVTIQELLDDRYCEQTEIRKQAMVKQHDLKEKLKANKAHMRQRRQDLKHNEILLREAKDEASQTGRLNQKLRKHVDRMSQAYNADRGEMVKQMSFLLDQGLTATDIAGSRGGPKDGVAAYAGRGTNGVRFYINNKRRVGIGVEPTKASRPRPSSAPPGGRPPPKVGSAPVDAWAYSAEKKAREAAVAAKASTEAAFQAGAPPPSPGPPSRPAASAGGGSTLGGGGGSDGGWLGGFSDAGSVLSGGGVSSVARSASLAAATAPSVSSYGTGRLPGGKMEALEERKQRRAEAKKRRDEDAVQRKKELKRAAKARSVLFGKSPF